MPRRRQRPNQFRFLAPLVTVAPFVAIVWFADQVMATVCSHLLRGQACPASMPGWIWGALLLVVMGASLASARRYWLDFHQGEYYLDLQDPNWRGRQ